MACHGDALFLFGGQDELGAHSTQLFKLPLLRLTRAPASASRSISTASNAARLAPPLPGAALGAWAAARTSGAGAAGPEGALHLQLELVGGGAGSGGDGGGESAGSAGEPCGLGPGCGLRSHWLELDSELPYNRNRCVLLGGGQLTSLQLGSVTLGRVNDDEIAKGVIAAGGC